MTMHIEYVLRSERKAAERRRRNWVLMCAATLIFLCGLALGFNWS